MPRDFVPLSQALAMPRQKMPGPPLVIYAMVDRSDMRVRYVGVTKSGNLDERLRKHRALPTNREMRAWLEVGDPVMSPLEYVNRAEWEAAERGWIFWFRSRGNLLNVDPGGLFRDAGGRPRGFVPGKYQPPKSDRPSRPQREQAELKRLIERQRIDRKAQRTGTSPTMIKQREVERRVLFKRLSKGLSAPR